jgi:hypothetical protein
VFTINTTFSQQAGSAMPVSGVATLAAARTFPTMGGVSTVAAAAGSKRRIADVAPVCGYTHITDAVVLGAFPGTSAWSPPI